MTLKELSQQLGDTWPNSTEVLRAIGLQRQPTVADGLAAMLGMFGLGILVGGGVALLFAPRPGRALREDLGTRIDGATAAVSERFGHTTAETAPA
jgi:hypothetical protein